MKGRLLSYEEVKKPPPDTRVYLQIDDNMLLPVISKGFDTFYILDKNNNPQDNFIYVLTRELMRVIKVYEWIEDPVSEQTITKTEKEENTYTKTYKGSEILAMIEDGRLKDEDIVISKYNEEYSIKEIKSNDYELTLLIDCSPFTIKQKPVDFMTAVNSGLFIRPVSLNKQKGFQSYVYWLGFMVSGCAYCKEPKDLINELWEVEY